MNATSAFAMGTGGSLSQSAADQYGAFMGSLYSQYENISGWLSGTVESVKQYHNNFMNSRMWEFSKRVGKDGHHVGRFEIGYLSEAHYQQQAVGHMRNYIMANPAMMQLYLDERISGYGGEFSGYCSGLGRDNYFYNKSIDGMNRLNEDGDLVRTDYHTSRDSGTTLSVRERVDIGRTWRASNVHIAKNLFDPSNTTGGNILSQEQLDALRKAEAEGE